MENFKEVDKMPRIQCIKCKEEKGVRSDVLKKRIKKAGSEKKLRRTYVCRKCRAKGKIKTPNKNKNKSAKKKAKKK
jgi:hypothetical protein